MFTPNRTRDQFTNERKFSILNQAGGGSGNIGRASQALGADPRDPELMVDGAIPSPDCHAAGESQQSGWDADGCGLSALSADDLVVIHAIERESVKVAARRSAEAPNDPEVLRSAKDSEIR
jgi:hypothetical protein